LESNPPSPSKITIGGFEDRESHRTPCASWLSYEVDSTLASGIRCTLMNIREAPRLPFFHAGPRDWPSTADLFGYGSVVAEPGSFCMVLPGPAHKSERCPVFGTRLYAQKPRLAKATRWL